MAEILPRTTHRSNLEVVATTPISQQNAKDGTSSPFDEPAVGPFPLDEDERTAIEKQIQRSESVDRGWRDAVMRRRHSSVRTAA